MLFILNLIYQTYEDQVSLLLLNIQLHLLHPTLCLAFQCTLRSFRLRLPLLLNCFRWFFWRNSAYLFYRRFFRTLLGLLHFVVSFLLAFSCLAAQRTSSSTFLGIACRQWSEIIIFWFSFAFLTHIYILILVTFMVFERLIFFRSDPLWSFSSTNNRLFLNFFSHLLDISFGFILTGGIFCLFWFSGCHFICFRLWRIVPLILRAILSDIRLNFAVSCFDLFVWFLNILQCCRFQFIFLQFLFSLTDLSRLFCFQRLSLVRFPISLHLLGFFSC